MKMRREPAVAGFFYPSDPKILREEVETYLGKISALRRPLGVISPHAGYRYSGATAGKLFASIEVPESVIILGPKHTRYGAESAIMTEGSWAMPCGEVPIDSPLAQALEAAIPELTVDAQAHAQEHSLEVQIPFLKVRQPHLKIVPIALAYRSFEACQPIAQGIAHLLKNWSEPVLIVASSDMNHFENIDVTREKDQKAIQKIEALDPQGLHEVCRREDISMCGVIPATILLLVARELRASKAELIHYDTSATQSGDLSRVVGYASLAIYP